MRDKDSRAANQTSTLTGPRAVLASAPLKVIASGGVFLTSGASLVVYILTGAPMALVLGLLVVLGAILIAATVWSDSQQRTLWLARVRVGIPAGLISTFCYDGSRYLLVQVAGFSASPFAAFPLFGQALIGDRGLDLRTVAGIGFHLLNGMAFGIAYTVWFGHLPFWWGIPFALVLEAFMLSLYPGWLDLRTVAEFTQMSLLGHIVYGTVLGFLAHRWLTGTDPDPGSGPRAAGSS